MAKVNTDIRIPAVEEFLAKWRERANTYFRQEIAAGKAKDQAHKDFCNAEGDLKYMARRRMPEAKKLQDDADTFWWRTLPNYLLPFRYATENGITEELNKVLDREVTNKRDALIYRTNEKIGDIVDASGLYIGSNGEINGFVVGTTGKARVETIYAGGYNIQCLHYRVLIKVVK